MASSLNTPTASHLERAVQVARQIRSRTRAAGFPESQRVPYLWHEYEGDINRLLEAFLPQCVLSGVKLFTPSFLDERDFGLEVDNLLHISHRNTDYLVLVESKNQPILPSGNEWPATYAGGRKDVKLQLEGHIRALLEYLEPISKDVDLKFICYVVVPSGTAEAVKAVSYRNSELYLTRFDELIPHLAERLGLSPSTKAESGDPRRIAQSPFLDLLRMGFANNHLGHPELSSAVRYVERCRRELDQALFKHFEPTPERWLINGSAGMGKSVLLAYSAAVLSSGYHMQKSVGGIGTYKATEKLEKIGFEITKGSLGIVAMSQKQLDSLRYWFEFFVREFQKADQAGDVHFRRPEFFLAKNMGILSSSKRPWAAVFVDEAHDLPDHAARSLREASDQLGFYLVAACDRHQRLKLAGSDSRAINGFSFKGKSKRLRQVYRNPAPIYIASLALMFRWFATVGPKIIPKDSDLRECFGFAVERLASQPARLSIKTDAHPANSWRHTVARFGDASTVATLLRREKLTRSEVLWARFSVEDPSFDYEALQQDFTYHNCRTEEATDLSDKYIKGQDYPVVVIEGFPRFMDQFKPTEDSPNAEDEMWAFRRELYLCSSRATCFLFFVCSGTSGEEVDRISDELDALVGQVSAPWENGSAGNGTRTWSFLLRETGESRSMDQFADAIQSAADVGAPVSEIDTPHVVMAQVSDTEVLAEIGPEETFASEEERPAIEPAPEELAARTPPPGSDQSKEEADARPTLEPEPSASSVQIANAYGEWPIEEEQIPPFKWVLVVNESESVRDFAESLGTTVPDLLGRLRNRGLSYASNSPIPVPVMRSLAFEFLCYPAASQEEYNAVSDGEAAADEETKVSDPSKRVADDDPRLKGIQGLWRPLVAEHLAKQDKNSLQQVSSPTSSDPTTAANHSASTSDQNVIRLKQPIIVAELATKMGLKPFVVLADLIKLQVFVAPHQAIDPAIATKVCELHGFIFERERRSPNE